MNRARQLLDDLSAYVPEGGADARSLARIRELVATASDPFTREVPHHVTAAAVIARPDGSAFLLVHHRRLERWLQPGGHVEAQDATVLDGARREAREETGVPGLETALGGRILDVDVHDVAAKGARPAHVHYDVRYLFTTSAAGRISARRDEVRDARWFSWDAVRELETDESLLRALAKARSLLQA